MHLFRAVVRHAGKQRAYSIFAKFARENFEATLGTTAIESSVDAEDWLFEG